MNAKIRAFTGTSTKKKLGSLLLLLPLMWYGCASTPKSTLPPNANANDEIMRLQNDLSAAKANDFALLDRRNFEKSQEHLMEAKEAMREGESQAEVLEHVAIARGYYERADMTSSNRRSAVESAIDARSKAVQAGAMKYPQSREALMRADDDLRDVSEDDSAPSAEKVRKLQDQYSRAEAMALEISHLGPAASMIKQAEANDAEDIAPTTLNQARVDYFAAKNALISNRDNKGAYESEVRQANLSADTLSKVMAIHARNRDRFNEREAVQHVWQQRRTNSLARMERVQRAEQEGAQARMQFEEKAMANVVSEIKSRFKPDEATVRQEGNEIVLQLKSMNFPVGKAEVPEKADPLLAKAQAVITDFQPSKVVVQGHTDSTGSKEINEELAQKRAETVASILKDHEAAENIEIEAKGAEMPLASNKTKSGRAQNRRADIIMTPSELSF